jgi:hypothetical protein
MRIVSTRKISFLLILAAQAAPAAADGWSRTGPLGEPFGPTRQGQRNCQGRNCGARTPYDCGPGGVDISPSPASGGVGIPLTFKYDATQICNGQTIANPDFSVRWDDGPPMPLGDAYGFATKTFTTQGEHHAIFEVRCTCVDVTGQSKCILTGTVRITIGVPPKLRDKAHVSWSLPRLKRGDCIMEGATLSLMANGKATFSARVMTGHTHGRDLWHQFFSVGDGNGMVVLRISELIGPDGGMSKVNQPYTWETTFSYDPSSFYRLVFLDFNNCRC